MSRRERNRRRRRRSGSAPRRLGLGVGVLLLAGVLVAAGGVGWVLAVAGSTPDLDELKPVNKGENSVVYAANGKRLGFIQSDELRQPVPARDFPGALRKATVAIEDERFYEHDGVDYEGVARAALKNLEEGTAAQGGSTITMQLMRNLYISNERTIERKIKEAALAQQVEKEHSKKWILDQYLNNVPYGTNNGQTAIGAESAARVYFNKPVRELSLGEAATLAGLPQAPSLFNPFTNGDGARKRRNEVLKKMAQLKMISPGRAAKEMAKPLGVEKNDYYTAREEAYFFDYVKNELIEKYGVNTVRRGGLRIDTTIDLELQDYARQAIADQLYYPDDPSSAIVSIDPRNGYIRAMASSGNYTENKYNLAAQGRRQPGSTFKVMVLMAALRAGIDPRSTSYTSRPLDLQTEYGPWQVNTYSRSYGGSMNLVEATTQSDNTVYAQLILDVGPEQVKKMARDMGITSKLEGFPAEGLGGLTDGVSPLEMANAYATIASGGWRNKPIAITKVKFPDGKVDNAGKPKRKKVFSDGIADQATQILEQNMQRGTATKAQIGCPAAAKTGTTDDFNDAWLVGYTPHMATAAWVGYPDAQVEMRGVHGIDVAGGTIPAMIWGEYMNLAKRDDCADFSQPKEAASLSGFYGGNSGGGGGYDGGGGGGTDPITGAPTGDPVDGGAAAQDLEGGGGQGGGAGLDGGGAGSDDGGGSTGGYDPSLYEEAPQQVPDIGQ